MGIAYAQGSEGWVLAHRYIIIVIAPTIKAMDNISLILHMKVLEFLQINWFPSINGIVPMIEARVLFS